jgi:hypothetical protein
MKGMGKSFSLKLAQAADMLGRLCLAILYTFCMQDINPFGHTCA